MKLLITGDRGCIGSVLKKVIPYEYECYDRVENTGNPGYLEALIQKCDIVIHLAALTDVTECENNPQQCIRDNISLTNQIVLLCQIYNKKIIFTSSCAVYGENYPELKPLNKYGNSKLTGENLILNYMDIQNVCIFRLSNVFGIPKGILHLIKTLDHIKIYGDTVRNFIHVNDVCRAMISCCSNFRPGIHDIGNEKYHFVKKLAEQYAKSYTLQAPLPYDIVYSHVLTDIFKFIDQPLESVENYLGG